MMRVRASQGVQYAWGGLNSELLGGSRGLVTFRPVVHLLVLPPSFLVHCTNLLLGGKEGELASGLQVWWLCMRAKIELIWKENIIISQTTTVILIGERRHSTAPKVWSWTGGNDLLLWRHSNFRTDHGRNKFSTWTTRSRARITNCNYRSSKFKLPICQEENWLWAVNHQWNCFAMVYSHWNDSTAAAAANSQWLYNVW